MTQTKLAARVRQQEVVAELGQSALAQRNMPELLDQAVLAVAHTLGVTHAHVLSLSPDGYTFTLQAGIGWDKHLIGKATMSASACAATHAGYTLQTGQPVVVENLRTETRFAGGPLLHGKGIVSGLSVLIYGQDTPYGILSVYSSRRRRFNRDDIHFLQSTANILAAAIERQQAEDALRESLERMSELYATSQHIGLVKEPDDILEGLLRSSYLQNSLRASIAIFDHPWLEQDNPPQTMQIIVARGAEDPARRIGQRYPVEIAWLAESFATHKPIFIEDVYAYSSVASATRDHLRAIGTVSLTMFPLVANKQWFGALFIHYAQRRVPLSEGLRHIQGLVDQAAVAIHNMQLLEREASARREAEKASEMKLKFLAMISHELRTPLTSIKGFATTLLAEDVSWEPAQQRDFIETINQEADKLTDMIEQLLDLSRLDAGALRIHPEPQSLSAIIAAAAAHLKAITTQHQLHLAIPDDLPLVNADRQRAAQVLINLVDNAVKYSPRHSRITVSARRGDGHVQIDVQDEGKGILPQERQRVFEAFRRGEDNQVKRTKGAGLGLAICKGLIEAHGGHIWVQEHDGPGTTISFTLPQAAE